MKSRDQETEIVYDPNTNSYVERPVQRTTRTQRAGAPDVASAATNLAAGAKISDLASSAGAEPAAAAGEYVGFGRDAGTMLPTFGEEMGAATPATPGMFDLAGIGTAGNVLLPAAGAYGMYDLFGKHAERSGTGKGALQGAASGAALGSYFGPVGAAIGGGLGGIGGLMSTKSRTRGEQHQRDALIEAGINVPIDPNAPEGKAWELNPTFRESRKESDLLGKDIVGASDFYAKIGGYDKLDAAKQQQIADEALKRGLIQEKLGKINLDYNPEFQQYVTGMMAPTSTRNAGADKKERARAKAAKIIDLLPAAKVSQAPNYGINIVNPYLTR